jgi:hypothetical protein
MKISTSWVAVALMTTSGAMVVGLARAAELFAYPPSNRTAAQQQQDKFECHQWAAEQTSFDPVEYASQGTSGSQATAQNPTSNTASATQSRSQQSAGKPLVGGAAQGAAIAKVSGGDVSDAAATGAGLRLLGNLRARKQAEQQAAQSQQKAQQQTQLAAQQQTAAASADLKEKQQSYDRARATCFKARGYTVSEG